MMAGQLLGYGVEEITRLMPEMEAFAEIGEYFDQPVRVYSSGMQVRLAFSVATAIRPDVLIIDEALSVGDAYFQHKSFDRIRAFRKSGTTLLIVSHDKAAIQAICDRAILINAGVLDADDVPEKVFDYYTAIVVGGREQTVTQTTTRENRTLTVSGNQDAIIEDVWIVDDSGRKVEAVLVGQEIGVCIKVSVKKYLKNLVVGCGFRDRLGQLVFGTNTSFTNQVLRDVTSGSEYVFTFKCTAALGVGAYSTTVAIQSENPVVDGKYHWMDNNLVFEVINRDKLPFAGVAWTEMNFCIDRLK
jgi:lipopolysaccharide transport system ATP-binding protein